MNQSSSGGNYNTPKAFKKRKLNLMGYKPTKLSYKSKVVDYKNLWEDLSHDELLEKLNYLRIKQEVFLKEISAQNINNYNRVGDQITEILGLLEKKNKKIKLKELFLELVKEEKQLRESKFDLESYIASLSVEDPKLKKHIISRVTSYDAIEQRLNKLIPLLKQAKQETLEFYKRKPSFDILYGTDLAVDYLDDLLKLFEK